MPVLPERKKVKDGNAEIAHYKIAHQIRSKFKMIYKTVNSTVFYIILKKFVLQKPNYI